MTTPLTPEEVIRYTPIIDGILATADLETITRKKIVHGMQTSLGGIDLSHQKAAIKVLIMSRFDEINKPADAENPDSSRGKRSATSDGSDVGETDPSESPEPARKKIKRSSSAEDADARLAAQLQAEENSLARSRKTRGGGDKAKTSRKQKSAPRKKSSKKVSAEDDSDLENSEAAPKRKAGGGFQKPFVLSATLSELCGETQLSRPQVVKKLWEHIKANDLQDPKDRRQIICDEKMMAVFKQAKVDMFRMNKEIGNHLYPVGEE